jgi:hypothetical protein
LTLPAHGFQIRSVGADIAPGEEREYCEVAQLPGTPLDEYYVSAIELANAKSSHHLALAVADRGTQAALQMEELGNGGRIECSASVLAFGEGIENIQTIQTRYRKAEYPRGVARRHFGGEFVVLNYHYANSGTEVVQARSAVNFHLLDRAAVEHVAEGFGLNDVTIDVAPGQTGSVTGECHFDKDLMVGALIRHTHRWSTEFTVWHSGGTRDGEPIWTSLDWEHETEYTFPEPALLRAGEGLRYRCTYANDTNRPLRFGTSVKDEMCMLYGPAWPAHSGETLGETYCNVTWIDGEGIGHPATEAGGFPEPSAEEVAICSSAAGSSPDACASCACNSCATPGIKCASDADCQPLLACLVSCTDVACIQDCQALIREHSSAAGLFMSAAECMRIECPVCFAPLQ